MKPVTWIDNQKHVGVAKSYMQTPTVLTVSLEVRRDSGIQEVRKAPRRGQWSPGQEAGVLSGTLNIEAWCG